MNLSVATKLNDIDPLAEMLTRVADTPIKELGQLLPRNWPCPRRE